MSARAYFDTAPLTQLVWRDMLLIGTAINVLATVLALTLFAARAPTALAAAVHFLPVPFNVFVCLVVWRRAGETGGAVATFVRAASVAWLALVVIL